MRNGLARLLAVVAVTIALLAPVVGCSPGAWGLQDWQRDVLTVGLSALFDLAGLRQTQTITERQCFENQGGTLVQIDCSTIPGG